MSQTAVRHMAKSLGDDPALWSDSDVDYSTNLWTLRVRNARVQFTGPTSGIAWTVDVGIAKPSLLPAVVRFSGVSASGDALRLGELRGPVLRNVELGAIALASLFGRRVDGAVGLGPLRPAEARPYLRRILSDPTVERVQLERSNGIDYRRVAELYLKAHADAAKEGKAPQPFSRVKSGMEGCGSQTTARQWVRRAAAQGWLTDDLGGDRRGVRSAGPRLLAEGWTPEQAR